VVRGAVEKSQLAASDGILERFFLEAQVGKAAADLPGFLAHDGGHVRSFPRRHRALLVTSGYFRFFYHV
jgi:hypothetical protein